MMNSLLKKRLPGILAAGLAMLAVGAAGTTPAAASSDFGVNALDARVSTSKAATTSALTKGQRRARARSLRVCKVRRRTVRQRRVCMRRVIQRFNRIARKQQRPRPNRPRPNRPGQPGRTHRVMVQDPYSYSPNQLNIKVNDSILWDWSSSMGREPHDVTPTQPWPAGVNRNGYKSSLMTGPNATFKRQFTKPGVYSFVCSIHFQMTMDVRVTR